jgi:hypothetical protein
MRSKTAIAPLVAVMLLVVPACGPSRPAVAPVSGRISRDGKQVTTGVVWFYPAAGRPATGQIEADGRYTLGTFTQDDGALLGSHRVVIESRAITEAKRRPPPKVAQIPDDMPEAIRQEWEAGGLAAGAEGLTWLVPEKYAAQATTPLRAEVQPGRNVIDFDIPSPAK